MHVNTKRWGINYSLFKCIGAILFAIFLVAINSIYVHAGEWNVSKVLENIEPANTGRPAIAVDNKGIPHIVWPQRGADDNYHLYYANSSNNWSPTLIADTCSSETPSIFIDETNTVYIAWTDTRNGPNGDGSAWDVYYASPVDNWINHLVTAGPTYGVSYPRIAVDKKGDIHITFIRYTTAGVWPYNNQVFYTNKLTGWYEKRISFTPYGRIKWAEMDVDNYGGIHVAFSNYATGSDPDGNFHIWYANSESNWMNILIDSDTTTNWWDDRYIPSIDVDSSNIVHIAWQDSRNTALPGDPAYDGGIPNRVEIYYANSANNWDNVEVALPEDTDGPRVKREPSIAVHNGLVHISWVQKETDEDTQQNFYYANSTDWDNAVNISNYPGTLPHTYAVRSSTSALSIDNNGYAHVAWLEYRNNTYTIYYASNVKIEIDVQIDVKPGKEPNILNLKSGGFSPVAILAEEDFDINQINTDSVKFGPNNSTITRHQFKDVDRDGDEDLLLYFRIQQTGILCSDTQVTLTGELYDGTPIIGSDSIQTKNCPQ